MADGATAIVSRHLGDDARRRATEDELVRRCADTGRDVLVVPHLYHLAHESSLWVELAGLRGRVAVACWMPPRPAEWVLREHEVEAEIATVVDLGAVSDAAEAFEQLAGALGDGTGTGEVTRLEQAVRERWYPVLDRSRCIACRHCLQFCIFGVFEVVGRDVVAARPDNCKPGCPACSRICPEGAIMFPMSDEPAIAGVPGTVMSPDPMARRTYYVRTGRRCPVCGEVAEAGELAALPDGVAACEECGRPLADTPGWAAEGASAVFDEIDALIDTLDDLAAGSGSGTE